MKEDAENPDHLVNETVDYKPEDIKKLIKENSNSSEKENVNEIIDIKSGFKDY